MDFLFVAIPVIVVVVGLTFAIVMFSDSNRHVKNMDTASQLELERKREEALEEIRKIKARGFVPEEESPEKSDNTKDDLNTKVNAQADEIEKLRAELEELKKNNRAQESYKLTEKNNILNFSKENIVRGLIAKEYLPKKDRR